MIAGHQRAGRDDGPEIIEETRQYIRDFDRIAETTSTAEDLYDQVIALYPERINPDALWISAQGVKPSRSDSSEDGVAELNRLIEVPEYEVQAEVRVEPARTALVVVDMQNDFVREGGGLLVPDAEATIPAISALLELARAHEMRVVYSQDTHREGDPEWRIWPEHARVGSWGWEIVDELAPGETTSSCANFATTRSTERRSITCCGSGASTRS